jgi:hypothetical protein
MPTDRARKSTMKRPPPPPQQVVRDVLAMVMQGDDPGIASKVIAATRKAGLGPSDDECRAWVARFESSRTTPYHALDTAIRTLDDAGDLVDALVVAAARDGVAPPADQPWMDGFDWASLDPEVRWKFIRLAIEDAANASQFSSADQPEQASLGTYLQLVLPTLIPEAIDRLEWWFERARRVSRNRDTDLDFGGDAQAAADEWIGEASKAGLPTLLRLAVLLQHPPWGASSATQATLLNVYERLGAALPPPRRRPKDRRLHRVGADTPG